MTKLAPLVSAWITNNKVKSHIFNDDLYNAFTDGVIHRFDIVVFNYQKLGSFFTNFRKIINFDMERDRITVVSCSPDVSEQIAIEEYVRQGYKVRYLTRQNFGMAEYARLEYFSRYCKYNDFDYTFTFQMQDHYLDMESPFSRWGEELDFRVKGDVIPDGTVFDLDMLEQLFIEERIDCVYCDRNNPCYFEFAGERFIAPNGANFIFRTALLADEQLQVIISELMLTCDNTYDWAVFMEFVYGILFFQEGKYIFDLKRNQTITSYDINQFNIAPCNFSYQYNKYTQGNLLIMIKLLNIITNNFHFLKNNVILQMLARCLTYHNNINIE